MRNYFYSKLLLFGEYTIITGGEALAMPLRHFRGFWDRGDDRNLQQNLSSFAEYLSDENFTFLQIENLKKDLSDGWYFQSNIPSGYGAGSSGALVAGILKKYGDTDFLKQQNLIELKGICGRMESFFHGSSSGTDPLISFLNQPVHLKKNAVEKVRFLSKKQSELTFFLLDTKLPRKTTPFVNHFLEEMKNPAFAEKVKTKLMHFNQKAIESFLKNEDTTLLENFEKISRFQFQHFQKMIPHFLNDLWKKGLTGNAFKLKICGAGGGGFMIGMTKDWDKTQSQITDFTLIKLDI